VRSIKDYLDEQNVSVVVISFAQPRRLLDYQEHHRWPFIVLADPARNAYRHFDLKRLSWFRVFSPSTLRLYFRLLREGRKIQNFGKDDYSQAGGDFLLDREGTVLFAHRSKDPADRPSAARIVAEINKLKEPN
jgi:peroxiredoxin